jgi:hypothetical protein
MSDRREKLNNTDVSAPENYTLEAILSEYKSEAFINNEKRLSKEQLEERAQAIINEMRQSVDLELTEDEDGRGRDAGETAETGETPAGDTDITDTEAEEEREPGERPSAADETVPEEGDDAEQPEEETGQEENPAAGDGTADEDGGVPQPEEEEYFDNEIYAGAEFVRKSAQKAEAAITRSRVRRRKSSDDIPDEDTRLAGEDGAGEKKPRRELTWAEAMRRYASGTAGMRRRELPAMVISFIMAAVMLAHGRISAHSGIMQGKVTVLVMLCALAAVMLLCFDVILRGISGAIRLKPRSDTLVTLACLAALADAAAVWAGAAEELGLPFCAAAALSAAFSLRGERLKRSGYKTSLRMMKAAKIPTVVAADGERIEEGTVLSKSLGTSAGFLPKLFSPGLYEKVGAVFFPLATVGAVVLAVFASVLSGGNRFLHCLAAISTVSASLTVSSAFSGPFASIARRLADYGAVIAGWSGAEEIDSASGIIIKDTDLFPENTVSLNGVKVLYGAPVDKIISYTGSLIIASGSGLSRLFGELLREYAAPLYRVDEFSCHEGGGIGAVIGGDRVLVGSGAFMKLMSIRVPDNIDVPGAVYSAVNSELSGVFIINYNPSAAVRNSLDSLKKTHIRPLFALRDFNITPAMLKSKYGADAGEIDLLSFSDRYSLSSDRDAEEQLPACALMSREGLNNYTEVLKGGKRLIRSVRRMLLLTVVSSSVGMLTVFFACARGAFSSASVFNVLIYLLLWALASALICGESS